MARLTAAALAAAAQLASAQTIRFSNVFGSNMVLQHSTPNVTVWGWATPSSPVNVTLANATYSQSWMSLAAAEGGAWNQALPVLPLGGGPYTLSAAMSQLPSQTVTLTNILAGDVYWCGGQSNMQLSVSMTTAFNGTAEIAGAGSYPQIRVFSAGSSYKAKGPAPELGVKPMLPWSVASPASVGGPEWTSMSAVCWQFGRKLADALGPSHPLGLISNNYGGSTVGSWLDTQRFAACNASSAPHGEPPNIHGNNPTVIYDTFFPPYTGPNGVFRLKGFTWLQGEEEADLG